MLSTQWKSKHTRKISFHANVKSIQEKEKYAVRDSPRSQGKQHSVKYLHRRPDNLLPFNYAASSISTWQIQKDVTSRSELNPTLAQNLGQFKLMNCNSDTFIFSSCNQMDTWQRSFWLYKYCLFKNSALVNGMLGRQSVIIFNHRVGQCLD